MKVETQDKMSEEFFKKSLKNSSGVVLFYLSDEPLLPLQDRIVDKMRQYHEFVNSQNSDKYYDLSEEEVTNRIIDYESEWQKKPYNTTLKEIYVENNYSKEINRLTKVESNINFKGWIVS
jgi:hypothetical protein